MLTDLQRHKLPRLFAAYDADSDGRIEMEDFDRLLQRFAAFRGWTEGSPPYDKLHRALLHRWEHMRKYADSDGDGLVTLAEWLTYIDAVLKDRPACEAELDGVADAVFGVFDVDDDGALSSEELRALYRGLGLGPDTATSLYERLEMGPGERMTRDQFIDLFEQFLTSPDPGAPGNWLFGG